MGLIYDEKCAQNWKNVKSGGNRQYFFNVNMVSELDKYIVVTEQKMHAY